VDVNSASTELLRRVSGLTEKTAAALVKTREEKRAVRNAPGSARRIGMGPKTFEQAAGFLRITGGREVLDGSAGPPGKVRPGLAYGRRRGMRGRGPAQVERAPGRDQARALCRRQHGLPTIRDILAELEKPGRDPRKEFEAWSFGEGVNAFEDVKPGMVLPGVVSNVTDFGAFVDIGCIRTGWSISARWRTPS
jgi:uncharacterized protein